MRQRTDDLDADEPRHIPEDLAVGPFRAARHHRDHAYAVERKLVPPRRILEDVTRNEVDAVFAKELLGAQAAGSARVPIHADLSVRGSIYRHLSLAIATPRSSRDATILPTGQGDIANPALHFGTKPARQRFDEPPEEGSVSCPTTGVPWSGSFHARSEATACWIMAPPPAGAGRASSRGAAFPRP